MGAQIAAIHGQVAAPISREALCLHPWGPGEAPTFVTVTPMVGPFTHTDVTLWFLLDTDLTVLVRPDSREFFAWGWYPRAELVTWLAARADPQLPRFLAKVDWLTPDGRRGVGRWR